MAPTSRPRVGWAASSSLGSVSSSRARISFCWFPPESVRGLSIDAASPDVVLLDEPACEVLDLADRQDAPACWRTRGRPGGREPRSPTGSCLAPAPARVGPRARTRSRRSRMSCGVHPRQIAPPKHRCRPLDRPQPHDRVGEVALAVALHAGHADDLARLDLEGESVQPPPRARRRACSTGAPISTAGFSSRNSTGRPTIISASPLLDVAAGVVSPDHLASPQHRDAIGDLAGPRRACG